MPKPDNNPYLEEVDGRLFPTRAGEKYLAQRVTSTSGQVYAFTSEADPVVVAAMMARLSRRAGDMRLIYLDEFAVDPDEAGELINRVVTQFGDDSVQQLVPVQLAVEGASNLLTKLLEWGRIGAAYLEQSTRYIMFDQKDEAGRYNYYLPNYLPADLLEGYDRDMTRIFDHYSEVVRAIDAHLRETVPRPDKESDPGGWSGWPAAIRAQACDAARPMLPVATRSTVGLMLNAQAAEGLIMRLLANDLPEAQAIGQQILEQTRKVIPAFLERTDRPDRGGLAVDYLRETRERMQELASQFISQPPGWDAKPVIMTDYWPKDELDLVPEMLFDLCGLTITGIDWQLPDNSEGTREEIFRAYMGERLNRRHRPGRALENAHYSFELVGDYGTFRDLQRHRMVDDWRWQSLHPRFGYEVPALVSEAGCDDLYNEAFAISADLYTLLEGAGYPNEAQYATLLGHRMRYRFTANLRELFHMLELRTGPQGHPGYRKLCLEMYHLLEGVHPLAAAEMKFVNQADNLDELTRLASERATANKLSQMS
jgi:thymidylate synthase ThyX